MKFGFSVGLISFYLVVGGAHAMSLSAVFDAALRNNENVSSQDEAVTQAQETVRQAWGSIIPQISGSAQWMWQQQYTGPNGALSPDYNPQTKVTASQTLFQGFREFKGLDLAKKQLGQQRFAKDNVELTVFKNLITSYYTILSFEQDLRNLQEEIGYIKSEIKLLEHWRQIGRVQLTDVLTAQSNLTAQSVLIEQTTQSLKVARDQFALTTGLPGETPLDDDTSAPPPTLGALDAYLGRTDARPDIKANEHAVQASQDNINVQKANHIPSLSLTANRYLERVGVQQNVNWDATVVLTVPIFAGGVTQSKVRQAYSQSHQAELALSLSKRTAEQEIRQYYDSVRSDLRLLELNTQNVKVNEANYKEEERYLRLGLVPYLNVITALTNYIQAKRTLDQNKFSLRNDFAHLNAAVAESKGNLATR